MPDLLLGFSVQQDEMNNNTGKALGAASNTIHYAPWYSYTCEYQGA